MPKTPRRSRGKHKAKSGPYRMSETGLLKQFRGNRIDIKGGPRPTDTFFNKTREGQGAWADGPKSYWRPIRNGLPEFQPYIWDTQKLNNSWAARIAERNLRQAEEKYGIPED